MKLLYDISQFMPLNRLFPAQNLARLYNVINSIKSLSIKQKVRFKI
jgi:hypothetical protein